MTHLPTLDPFEMIDSPWGHIEAWRASTLATGTMGALAQVYDVVRNDAAARADEDAARASLIQHVCDKIAEFEKRFANSGNATVSDGVRTCPVPEIIT